LESSAAVCPGHLFTTRQPKIVLRNAIVILGCRREFSRRLARQPSGHPRLGNRGNSGKRRARHFRLAAILGSPRDAEKPLLHLWSENCNVTRRVVAITDNSQDRLALAVERFGRLKPERMEIVRLEYAPGPRDLSREGYCEQLRRILAEQFPDESLEKIQRRAGSRALALQDLYARNPAPRVVARGLPRGPRRRIAGRTREQPNVWIALTRKIPAVRKARRPRHPAADSSQGKIIGPCESASRARFASCG